MASRTVLVVDDNPEVRALASETLRDAGYCVLEAGAGDEAMLTFEHVPDVALIVTDIVMPGIDGFMLADMAKVRRPAVAILYTTAYAHRARDYLGVVHGPILRKPYRQTELLHAAEAALAGETRTGDTSPQPAINR